MADVGPRDYFTVFFDALIEKLKPKKIVSTTRSSDTDIDFLIIHAASTYQEIKQTWLHYMDRLAHRALVLVHGLNSEPMRSFWDWMIAVDKLDTGTVLLPYGCGLFYYHKSPFTDGNMDIDHMG